MKNSIKILMVILAFGAASCSVLDTEPYDFVTPGEYYDTAEELDYALNGIYATLATSSLYGNNMLGRMGLSADLGYCSYSMDYGSVGDNNVTSTDSKILSYWRELYDGIGRANMLLKYVDGATAVDESVRNNIKGQALFLRAYYHFMLVVRFKNIPLVLSVPEDSSPEQMQIPQSDPRDVYMQIIADMESAAGMVSPASEVAAPGRVSQSTVYGMLARASLYMAGHPLNEPGMYDKAKTYAKRVMDTGSHALNPSYEQFFLNMIQDKYDVQESIWEVEFYGNNSGSYTTTAGMVGRNNGIYCTGQEAIDESGTTAIEKYGYSIATIRTTPYFYELFEDGDLRRDWTIAPYTYNNTDGSKQTQTSNIWIRCCGKFRREYETLLPRATNYTSINFPILRYADILLIYAEAAVCGDNCTAEELALAHECVNRVRRRGFGLDAGTPAPGVDLATGSATELLDNIKKERARELGFELLRKDDIVRWGDYSQQMKLVRLQTTSIPDHYTSNYYLSAKRSYGNASSRDEIWPIPAYELGVNRALKQNVGW